MTVWDLLVGQDRAVTLLQEAARRARDAVEGDPSAAPAHAWILSGPPGSGRSVAARAFAAALECTGPTPGCGECEGCRTTLTGSHPDVAIHVTEAKNYAIKEVREEWLGFAQTRPMLGRWRVVLVEDADRISEDTSNLLLKHIEEPPERTIWLLCAPSQDDLLVTIRSRCRHLQLASPSTTAVASLLQRDLQVDEDRALLAAQVSQGHIGYARAVAKDPGLRAKQVELFLPALRSRSVGEAVFAAGDMLAAADRAAKDKTEQRDAAEKSELIKAFGLEEGARVPPALRAQMRQLEEQQKRRSKRALADELDRVLVDILGFLRDVLIRQAGGRTDLVNPDLEQEVQTWVGRDAEGIVQRVDAVALARRRLQANVVPLLNLESLLIALYDPLLAG